MEINIREIALARAPKATEDEIVLCNRILNDIRARDGFDHAHTIQIGLALLDFALIFRADKGLQAIWDFIKWCKENDEEYAIVVFPLGYRDEGRIGIEARVYDTQGRESWAGERTFPDSGR